MPTNDTAEIAVTTDDHHPECHCPVPVPAQTCGAEDI